MGFSGPFPIPVECNKQKLAEGVFPWRFLESFGQEIGCPFVKRPISFSNMYLTKAVIKEAKSDKLRRFIMF